MEALVDEEAVADEPAEGADDFRRLPDNAAGEEHTAEMLLQAAEEEVEDIQGKS